MDIHFILFYPAQPIKTIVNTSEDTIFARNINSNFGSDRQGLITVNLERSGPNVSWGFRLQGGKDRGLAFQILKVSGCYVPYVRSQQELEVIRFPKIQIVNPFSYKRFDSLT